MTFRRPTVQLAMLGADAVVFLASGVLLYVVISRAAGPTLLGQYSLVLAWMLVFQSLGNFGLPELLMRELGRFTDSRGDYIGAGLVLGLSSTVVVAPMLIGSAWLTSYDSELKRALTIAAISLPAAVISNVARSGFIACRRTGLVVLTRLFEFLAVVPLNVLMILQGHGVARLIAVLVTGRVASSLLALYLLHRHAIHVTWRPRRALLKTLISPAVTFAFSNSLGLIGMHMNPIMLSLTASVAVVGFYGAGSKLFEGMMLAPVLFGQFYMPQISASLAVSRETWAESFRGPFRRLFAVTVPAGVVLLVFPDVVVDLLFGPEFRDTVPVLRVLGLFYLVQGADAQMSMILKAAGLQRRDLRILTVNPTVNLVVNLALIPSLGGVGAALGQLSGALCSGGLRYFCIIELLEHPRWLSLVLPTLLWSLLAALSVSFLGAALPGLAQLAAYALLVLPILVHNFRSGPTPARRPSSG